MQLINPPKYNTLLKGAAPCNYGLTSRTMYRSLDIPDDMKKGNQIEAFYKYDYDSFNIDWAFRTFEDDDEVIRYNIFIVTDKGIFRDNQTRTIYDEKIYMRWTTFVSKVADRKPGLFITAMPSSRKLCFFYPKYIHKEYYNRKNELIKIDLVDTEGFHHMMEATPDLINALKYGEDYIAIDTMNYVPVHNFNMWYMVF